METTLYNVLYDTFYLSKNLDTLARDWAASGEDIPFVNYCMRPDVAKTQGFDFEEFLKRDYRSSLWAAHEYLDYTEFRAWCAEVGVDHVTALRIFEEDDYVER